MFFGKTLTLLLVFLFSLTGIQMILSQLAINGVVLGEADTVQSLQEHNLDSVMTVVPTVATVIEQPAAVVTAAPTAAPAASIRNAAPLSVNFAPATEVTAAPTAATVDVSASIDVTATPTVVPTARGALAAPVRIITPQPSPEIIIQQQDNTTQQTNSYKVFSVDDSTPVVVRNNAGSVVTTTRQIDRSTTETVRQIIKKIGIPQQVPATAEKTIEAAPVLQQVDKVVEERTAGEILGELSKIQTQSGESASRLRFKFINGVMSFVGETPTGQEANISASDSANLVARLERGTALSVIPGKTGEYIFTKGDIRAATDLPLLVDLNNSLLTTETSTGIKTIPLFPDEAIKIAFASRAVDGIYTDKLNSEITFIEAPNGHLVYQINGLSKRKIFGLIPLSLNETAYVDSGNGQVTQPEKSLGQLLVELVAFPAK